MKFPLVSLKNVSALEFVLAGLFALFVILPISLPFSAAILINSPIGLIALFCTTIFLFVYSRPLLGILFVVVAYELLRRSSANIATTPRSDLVQFTQTAATAEERNLELKRMNPPTSKSLEEDVISAMAPVNQQGALAYVNTSFKPVSTNLHNAFPM